MTDLMGEINAAERESDRIDILYDFYRVGLTKTLARLQTLGMNPAQAWDEIDGFINRRVG